MTGKDSDREHRRRIHFDLLLGHLGLWFEIVRHIAIAATLTYRADHEAYMRLREEKSEYNETFYVGFVDRDPSPAQEKEHRQDLKARFDGKIKSADEQRKSSLKFQRALFSSDIQSAAFHLLAAERGGHLTAWSLSELARRTAGIGWENGLDDELTDLEKKELDTTRNRLRRKITLVNERIPLFEMNKIEGKRNYEIKATELLHEIDREIFEPILADLFESTLERWE